MTVAAIAPHERISAAIRRACGRNPALVAFLTAGFPRRELFRTQLSAVAGVADVVEIGVPFTDPMADGLTIQRSSREALAQGVTLRWILDELAAMQAVNAPLLLMSYLNPLLAFAFAELTVSEEHARVAGFIMPDLPFD